MTWIVFILQPDKYSIYLHDAVLLYAKVLNASGFTLSKGTDIAKKTKDISFEGIVFTFYTKLTGRNTDVYLLKKSLYNLINNRTRNNYIIILDNKIM